MCSYQLHVFATDLKSSGNIPWLFVEGALCDANFRVGLRHHQGNSCITLIVKSELKIFAFPWYNWLIHISPFYLIHNAFPTFSKNNSLKRSKLVWKIYSKCIGPLSCPMFFMLLFLFPPCLPPFRTLISHNNVLKWCGTSLIFLMMEHLILPACYVRSAWIFS